MPITHGVYIYQWGIKSHATECIIFEHRLLVSQYNMIIPRR